MTTINFFIVFPAGWLADRFGRKPTGRGSCLPESAWCCSRSLAT
jgi:MFS family permease